MANGQALHLKAHTVAVDVSHKHWLDRWAWVLTECGTVHRVLITDTGYLYERGGWLRLGIQQGRKQYWPVLEDAGIEGAEPVLMKPVADRGIDWLEDRAYRVVADFPSQVFADEIACKVDYWGKGDTMKVWVWIGE